ncbi:hypothetical protein CJ030_MR4G024213 [Morella rubra]|uniref:Bet v I/Major latex protein domain-containing protein n=1 Tax=Morella rubra TaxID=262757 RepID=A0A6A1VQP3_9ROSI|nr:hypothetical protein CJ030_MR4G024213 [Morella rubra]
MSLFGKLEVEVEIKAPAHKFHEVNTTDGKTVVSKEVLEVVDNVNLSITFKLIGGPLLGLYKNVKFIVESTPKGEGGWSATSLNTRN